VPDDCLICQEHRLEVALPGDHLVVTDEVIAFHLPPWPPTAVDVYLGYLMVTPRRHVAGFADLTDSESAAMGVAIQRLSRALEVLGAERAYLAVIGHGVAHLHVHLLPRWPGTPAEVPWTEVDSWEGARRGDFVAATGMAAQIKRLLSQ
jgi:diadenosine tetraphosphate (Ap4A) HIT family hydrolase